MMLPDLSLVPGGVWPVALLLPLLAFEVKRMLSFDEEFNLFFGGSREQR